MSNPSETPDAEMLPGLRAVVGDARTRAAETRRRNAAAWVPAEIDPVARVLVDLPLPHLDKPFDYAVPASMADTALPGTRVKVRFAGRDVDAFVLARASDAQHTGSLQPLRRVVSPEVVLTPEVAELSATLARRYAGARADILRLAVPPRHATTERQTSAPPSAAALEGDPSVWAHVPHAGSLLERLRRAESPRGVWTAAPGDNWPEMLASAVAHTLQGGRGAIVCVADQRDVSRVDAALTTALGPGHHATLTAEAGPGARYRQFLSVSRGVRKVVVGTRSAAFAPVQPLGLVVIWDDGDDLHAEPRAPYPHVREVLLQRAEQSGAAALIGGFACTPEAHHLLESGWAHHLGAPREVHRRRARIDVVPADDRAVATRLPRPALDAIREGLTRGPVLVQTPRSGYAAALACERCRTPARCAACTGPLVLGGPTTPPGCRWCGQQVPGWSCVECGHRGLRAPVLGELRTAEELGRSFPGVTVRSSGGERVLETVPDRPAIIVSTVGAEPWAEAGFGAVLILDTWLTLARDDMRVEEEALRRWMGAAGLVREAGRVVAVGDPASAPLQALVRWDAPGFAAREFDQRASAHLPPAARLATITGESGAVDDASTLLRLPPHAEVLGPVPTGADQWRLVLRVPLSDGAALSDALGELQRVRSARKLDALRIQVDPREL